MRVGLIHRRRLVTNEIKNDFACALTSALQKIGGFFRSVDGDSSLHQGSIAAQVVHVIAGVDGGDGPPPEVRVGPIKQGWHGFRRVRAADYHQVRIGHLDEQRVGRPWKRMRDHERAVSDLPSGEIEGDVDALPGLGKDLARSGTILGCASKQQHAQRQARVGFGVRDVKGRAWVSRGVCVVHRRAVQRHALMGTLPAG